MANEILNRDQNHVTVLGGVTDDSNQDVTMLRVDPTTKRLLISATGLPGGGTVTSVSVVTANGLSGTVATATSTPAITLNISGLDATKIADGSVTSTEFQYLGNVTSDIQTQINAKGTGTVTSVSVATANGFSGTVATATTTPAITIIAGAIAPTTVNGLTISTTTGTLTMTNSKVLAVTNTLTLSGTDSTIMTFPSTSATIARIDAANTFTGASTASAWVLTSPTITTKISPTSDDGAPLGDTTHNFSDLFLAAGAVVNYANSDVVLTHTSGILTLGTGTLKITTPTNNTTSVLTTDATQTLTNKRVNPRVGTVADAATITPTGDSSDLYTVTALAQAATIAAPSGTPVNGQKLIIRLLDNGTARALTWDSIYAIIGTTLPTTTVLSKYTYVGCIYNSASSKWDVVAVTTQV